MLDLGVDFRANNDSYFKMVGAGSEASKNPLPPCVRQDSEVLDTSWVRSRSYSNEL